MEDFSLSLGAILLGLKVPVSVGWEYGGLLGLKSSTNEFALMSVCCNWSLKELKLVLLNSI